MSEEKRSSIESIIPTMFDGFEPPADRAGLLAHVARLEKLASALHTKESGRDAIKESMRAAVRTKAAEKRAATRAKDAEQKRLPANRAPVPSPWDGNSPLAYVVELLDGDDTGKLAAFLVMEDFEALHPSPERKLTNDEEPKTPKTKKPQAKKIVTAGEPATEATETQERGANLKVEWARRFAWSVALSMGTVRHAERLPSAEEWSVVHEALLLGAAIRAGYRDIDVWKLALSDASQRSREASIKNAHNLWTEYHPYDEKRRKLALKHLRAYPDATPKDIADAIFDDIEHWVEDWAEMKVQEIANREIPPLRRFVIPSPTKATLARYIRLNLHAWLSDSTRHVES